MRSGKDREREAVRQLLVRGIASARAGEGATARFYLEKALTRASDAAQEVEAHYWLSQIEPDPARKRAHIERILAQFPTEPRARRELAILDGRLDPADVINPDSLQSAQPKPSAEAAGKRHECPQCGARLVYSPAGKGLQCENCGYATEDSTPPLPAEAIPERDFVSTIHTAQGHSKPETHWVFECRACGARFLLDPQTLALTCPHCDSVYSVATPIEEGIIPPAAFLPPEVDARGAEKAIRVWWREHKLKDAGGLGRLAGAYLPFWTFDILGHATWKAETTQDQQWQTITGTTLVDMDDILVPAIKNYPAGLEESLAELERLPLRPFSMNVLAGWLAETYTIAMADAAVSARAMALSAARRKAEQGLPGDYRRLVVSSLNLAIERYKLVLLPWWLGRYSLGGKSHAVYVNAGSGTVVGSFPSTPWRKLAHRLFGR